MQSITAGFHVQCYRQTRIAAEQRRALVNA